MKPRLLLSKVLKKNEATSEPSLASRRKLEQALAAEQQLAHSPVKPQLETISSNPRAASSKNVEKALLVDDRRQRQLAEMLARRSVVEAVDQPAPKVATATVEKSAPKVTKKSPSRPTAIKASKKVISRPPNKAELLVQPTATAVKEIVSNKPEIRGTDTMMHDPLAAAGQSTEFGFKELQLSTETPIQDIEFMFEQQLAAETVDYLAMFEAEMAVPDNQLDLAEVVSPVESDPRTEVLIEELLIAFSDDEVLIVYDELLSLADMPLEANAELTMDDQEREIRWPNDRLSLPAEANVSDPSLGRFENFIVTQVIEGARAEQVTPQLITVQEQANSDQPLAETFAQLGSILREASASDEMINVSDDQAVITELIKQIHQEVYRSSAGLSEEAKDQPHLTLETTKKLLLLLQTIGYQDPQKVLVEFVRRYDGDFLLSAIHYLYQSAFDENQHESLASTLPSMATSTEESLAVRLGRALISAMKSRLEFPELAA